MIPHARQATNIACGCLRLLSTVRRTADGLCFETWACEACGHNYGNVRVQTRLLEELTAFCQGQLRTLGPLCKVVNDANDQIGGTDE